jgi:hypothetical protein
MTEEDLNPSDSVQAVARKRTAPSIIPADYNRTAANTTYVERPPYQSPLEETQEISTKHIASNKHTTTNYKALEKKEDFSAFVLGALAGITESLNSIKESISKLEEEKVATPTPHDTLKSLFGDFIEEYCESINGRIVATNWDGHVVPIDTILSFLGYATEVVLDDKLSNINTIVSDDDEEDVIEEDEIEEDEEEEDENLETEISKTELGVRKFAEIVEHNIQFELSPSEFGLINKGKLRKLIEIDVITEMNNPECSLEKSIFTHIFNEIADIPEGIGEDYVEIIVQNTVAELDCENTIVSFFEKVFVDSTLLDEFARDVEQKELFISCIYAAFGFTGVVEEDDVPAQDIEPAHVEANTQPTVLQDYVDNIKKNSPQVLDDATIREEIVYNNQRNRKREEYNKKKGRA